ncbi:hypothetical protein AAVH_27821 [Aphelenchoides avenae]|nr:hypothetical protein AAVH_27821 [Aphelenchus avenae]
MNLTESFDYRRCISLQRNLEYVIILVYALPSLAVYTVVTAMLFLRLKATFYRIFALGGVLDILGWLVHFFCTRAIFFPSMFGTFAAMPKSGFVPSLLYFVSYYFSFAPYASTLFLTLNRFLAAFSVNGGRQKWFAPLAYVVVLLFPFPFTWYIWWSEVQLYHLDDKDPCAGFILGDTVKPWGLRKSMFLSAVSFGQWVVVMSINAAIASKLFLRRRHLHLSTAQVEDTRDTEVKLFLLTLIVFVYNISTCVCQVCFYVGGRSISNEVVFLLLNVQTFGEDLHVCTSPWFLILMSTAVRTELRRTFGIFFWQRKNTVGIIVRTTSSTRTI